MENRRENSGEKRRRKIVARPVLVRSGRPGQVMSASYERQRTFQGLWKAAKRKRLQQKTPKTKTVTFAQPAEPRYSMQQPNLMQVADSHLSGNITATM